MPFLEARFEIGLRNLLERIESATVVEDIHGDGPRIHLEFEIDMDFVLPVVVETVVDDVQDHLFQTELELEPGLVPDLVAGREFVERRGEAPELVAVVLEYDLYPRPRVAAGHRGFSPAFRTRHVRSSNCSRLAGEPDHGLNEGLDRIAGRPRIRACNGAVDTPVSELLLRLVQGFGHAVGEEIRELPGGEFAGLLLELHVVDDPERHAAVNGSASVEPSSRRTTGGSWPALAYVSDPVRGLNTP